MNGLGHSLRGLLREAGTRASRRVLDLLERRGREADALHRRSPSGELAGLPPGYFSRQTELIGPLMRAVRAAGELDPALLRQPDLATVGERAVEYPLVGAEVLRQRRGARVLDVGCVLNHSLMNEVLQDRCELLWLLNPSPESKRVSLPCAFLLGDVRAFPMPVELRFDLITCLSTLEHVGMNNERYGGAPQECVGLPRDPQRFAIDAARAMVPWLAPGGTLLLSIPLGPFEYLYAEGRPEAPIYYTFDAPRVRQLEAALEPLECSSWAYKAAPGVGWVPCPLDDPGVLPYGEGVPGAGGTAFVRARLAS